MHRISLLIHLVNLKTTLWIIFAEKTLLSRFLSRVLALASLLTRQKLEINGLVLARFRVKHGAEVQVANPSRKRRKSPLLPRMRTSITSVL
jgi:hypothetical protein